MLLTCSEGISQVRLTLLYNMKAKVHTVMQHFQERHSRYELSLAPRSQSHGGVYLVSPSKAREGTGRSISVTVKSEVKLSTEAFKAQTSCLFCQYLVTANKTYFSWYIIACFLLSTFSVMLQHPCQWHPLQIVAGSMVLLLFSFQSLFKDMDSIDYNALNIYLYIIVSAAFQTREVPSTSGLSG